MTPREECPHKVIAFHSGDHLLYCEDCGAAWVACDEGGNPGPAVFNAGPTEDFRFATRVDPQWWSGRNDSGGD